MRAMVETSTRTRLAENVRLFRTLRGWSQERLADAAGLDRSYLGGIERAQRNTSVDILARLAQALNVDVSDLLGEQDSRRVGEMLLASIKRSVAARRTD
jgi:transcriptional regulator with XRE-family HTH domain